FHPIPWTAEPYRNTTSRILGLIEITSWPSSIRRSQGIDGWESHLPAALVPTGVAQKAHRRAAMGIALRHSGHSLVVGSGGASPRRMRVMSAFIGRTTKKYTAAAIKRNETIALTKSPSRNLLPLISNWITEKSGFPTSAAINGVIKSLTRAVTTAPKAPPM